MVAVRLRTWFYKSNYEGKVGDVAHERAPEGCTYGILAKDYNGKGTELNIVWLPDAHKLSQIIHAYNCGDYDKLRELDAYAVKERGLPAIVVSGQDLLEGRVPNFVIGEDFSSLKPKAKPVYDMKAYLAMPNFGIF